MRIDLILKERKCFTYENYAAEYLQKSLQDEGVICNRIYLCDGILQDYLYALNHNPPDCTLSFQDIFSYSMPFCDIVKIPHLLWSNEPFAKCVHYLDSQHGKIACMDRKLAAHFSLPFFPHTFEPAKEALSLEEKKFEVVIFGDLIDLESKKKTWKEIFSKKALACLEEVLSICLDNPSLHPAIAAQSVIIEELTMHDLIYGVEEYLRAARMRELIESMDAASVDVFGEHVGSNWYKKLKNSDKVRLHGPLPYTEHFEVLRLSKILVRDQPLYSDGSDPWILPALDLGCIALSNVSSFLKEQLQDKRFFYHSFEDLNMKIGDFLKKPDIFKFPENKWQQYEWKTRGREILHFVKNRVLSII